jgi:N-acetylneuraminate synthase
MKNIYFIADIAANHDGDINRSIKLIKLAKDSVANAFKWEDILRV